MDPAVRRAFQDPSFYPHSTASPIRVIDTHLSVLFLTGDFVYKVKKPVKFAFVDYESLEARRRYVEEEVRLNERGAPGLYVRVAAVTRNEGRLLLDGDGEVVEHAVVLKQFEDGALFSERLQRGVIERPEVEELAAVVAAYHAEAPTSEYIRSFGDPDRVRRSIEGNFSETKEWEGRLFPEEEFERLQEWTRGWFEPGPRRDLLLARVKGRTIKGCHGDLHLRNICRWDGRILLFDAIEFNEEFRFVDPMYDVAFVVMDFEARGRADFARLFLDRYLERSGDYEGALVLPLYRSRQAFVRAKVASLLLGDPDLAEAARKAAEEEAKRYFTQAVAASRTASGGITIVSGVSGSGKSTTADRLTERSGGLRIRADALRKRLAGVGLDERGPPSLYSPEMTEATYEALLDIGAKLAEWGYEVVLDATFQKERHRRAARESAERAKLPFRIVYCEPPSEEETRQRILGRRGDASDATPAVSLRQRAEFEPLTEEELKLTVSDGA
jgi:aminoglycoside phosphotransferase family enzyme/predicted kinase